MLTSFIRSVRRCLFRILVKCLGRLAPYIRPPRDIIESEHRQSKEVTEAVYRRLGFHASQDLNYDGIIARGGTGYGHYYLIKCPKCERPILCDLEHDTLCTSFSDLNIANCFDGGEPTPCPQCGFKINADDIWQSWRDPVSYQDWLMSLGDIKRNELEWILDPTKIQIHSSI